MDTPNRIPISSPITSNFEDSPVFNYISNLSPIKPFKSNTAHTLQSITFASVPSVFTSPQPCSLKEAKCFKSSKTLAIEDASESKNDSPAGLSEIVELPNCSADVLENSMAQVLMEKTHVNSVNFLPKLPESFQHEYNSPDDASACSVKPCLGTQIFDTPETDACFNTHGNLQVDKEAGSDSNLCGRFSLGLAKGEPTDCDWDKFISDHSDLFMFDSSSSVEVSRVQDHNNFRDNSSASFATKFQIDNVSYQQVVGEASSSHGLALLQNTAFYGGRLGQLDGANSRPLVLPCSQNFNANIERDKPLNRLEVTDADSTLSDSKVESASIQVHNQQLRIMRRRCLVFDAVGVFTKSTDNGLKLNAATTYQSDGTLDEKTLVSYKHAVSSSPCMVPGIGLHLNTLATSSDAKVVKQEALSSGKHILSMPRSVTSVSSLTAVHKPITKRLVLSPADNGFIPCDKINVMEDIGQPIELGSEEESFRSSPTKKKRKMELEDEGCKKCNCKKSKCLKLYCECFAAGVYCVEPCSCIDCYNKPVHEDTVLSTRRQIESRNPMAFAPKVVWKSDAHLDMVAESADKTPASARHKRGCNCKKSSCNKKYCECFQGGVGCSGSCRCEGCKNAFGAKDGLTLATIDEIEAAEDTFPGLIKDELDSKLPLMAMQKDEIFTETHRAMTSLSSCRTLLKLPSSTRKPPRSHQCAGSAKKNGSNPSKTKLGDTFRHNLDDDTPEFLKGNISPCSGVKKLSPNSKRVSPINHNNTSRMSPGIKSSRRLILQSIASCPPQ